MTPIKTERVIHYEGGLERRSEVLYDENGDTIKPALSTEASAEWDNVTNWFSSNDISHLLDPNTLRDHCLAVARGDKDALNLP